MDKLEEMINSLENRIDKLENMIVHLHDHLEYILEKIEFHDSRLCGLGNVLLNSRLLKNATDKDIDTFLNPDINYIDIVESYTPINEEDKKDHEERIKKLRNITDNSVDIMFNNEKL